MAIPAGTYRLGPATGTLEVRTGRTGAAAKAGHNLVLHVTDWEATLVVPGDGTAGSLEVEADGGSLRVIDGTGGVHALSDDDKAEIARTIDDEVLRRERIRFRSTEVGAQDGALRVRGELTLHGTTAPLGFDVAVADGGQLRAVAVVRQTDWGMKPYSTLFGALKVVDEVEVRVDAGLPEPQSR